MQTSLSTCFKFDRDWLMISSSLTTWAVYSLLILKGVKMLKLHSNYNVKFHCLLSLLLLLLILLSWWNCCYCCWWKGGETERDENVNFNYTKISIEKSIMRKTLVNVDIAILSLLFIKECQFHQQYSCILRQYFCAKKFIIQNTVWCWCFSYCLLVSCWSKCFECF